MGFTRLVLLVVVAAVSFLSLAAFAQHLVLGKAVPFPGGAFFAIAIGVLAAINARRQESGDLNH